MLQVITHIIPVKIEDDHIFFFPANQPFNIMCAPILYNDEGEAYFTFKKADYIIKLENN